jgi:hypothetical protein
MRKRHRHANPSGVGRDEVRHATALELYDTLVLSPSRDVSVHLLERALLMAWISGSNSYAIEMGRRARLQRTKLSSEGVKRFG